MESPVKRIKEKLSPLRLYDLTPGSLVSAELEAYGAAFGLITELMEKLRVDSHVQTAEGAALRRYETLVGLPERGDISDGTRREIVIYRTSVAPYDFTAAKMLGSVRAAGIEAELVEDFENERLVIDSISLIDPTLTLEIAHSRLEGLLPAHLDWDLDFGFTSWGDIDSLGYDWNGYDALDTDWDSIDVKLQQIMGLA